MTDQLEPKIVAYEDKELGLHDIDKGSCLPRGVQRQVDRAIRLTGPILLHSGWGKETDEDLPLRMLGSPIGHKAFALLVFAQ